MIRRDCVQVNCIAEELRIADEEMKPS